MFLIINIIKNKKLKYHNLLLILICILLPIAMNSISLLNQNGFNHVLINSANAFNYVLLILLLESFVNKKYINRVCVFFIILQIYIYIIVANQSYLKMNIAYENAYSVYQDVVTRIKNMEEFNADSKIVIVGEYDYEKLCDFYNFDKIGYFFGVNSNVELVNVYSKYNFIEFYLGFNANFIEENEVKSKLEDNQIYKNMPTYPYYGSIQKIDDLIVVKFSD